MLSELRIKNLAIIDDLHMTFDRGFNVLTGETGAGKSIILDAVTLLLGGRADNDIVRSKSKVAYVEGIFYLDNRTTARLSPLLSSEGLDGDAPDLLVLGREVRKGGRNLCRVNGRTVTLGMLKEVGTGLIDIHGQSGHLSLLDPAHHIELLDNYAGLESQHESIAALVSSYLQVKHELDRLLSEEVEQARHAEMLGFEIEELSAANLQPGEDEQLLEERTRLANAEHLATLSDEAYRALYEEGMQGQSSAADLISEAAMALAKLAEIDADLKELHNMSEDLSVQAEELARGLRDYREDIEFSPQRLRETEERLQLINTLKRKYNCTTTADLLARAQQSQSDLDAIQGRDEHIQGLQQQTETLLQQIGREGASLSSARVAASDQLAQAIEAELAELKMEGARFGVSIEQIDDPQGAYVGDYRVAFDTTGIDKVEFLIAPNVGEPLKSMARIASGGETSRLMLALKSILSRADNTPTLIFDEIDQGIGGRIGAIVGSKLWGLSDSHQVMVVTHLPQLAGFGDAHFKVHKKLIEKRTVTRVQQLDEEGRIGELAEMLGSEAQSSQQSAREIIAFVQQAKNGKSPAPANL